MRSVLAVLTVVAALVLLWYAAAVPMNIKGVLTEAERAGAQVDPPSARDRRDASAIGLVTKNGFAIPATWAQERPRLPAPHQVAIELWQTTVEKKITSKRSLIYHGWVTLSATLLGFAIGTGLGILLAVGIVHSRVMDMSVMPWAIVSQTIPIIALAPMIIVVL
ncbi:ABC transporter permease, partial [Cribrihabitans sp. XS_ASV171]